MRSPGARARDRKAIRAYLTGERVVGKRQRTTNPFDAYEDYVRGRLIKDQHLWAQTLPTSHRREIFGPETCVQPANPARASFHGPTPSSSTRPVRKPNGIGSSYPTRRPDGA